MAEALADRGLAVGQFAASIVLGCCVLVCCVLGCAKEHTEATPPAAHVDSSASAPRAHSALLLTLDTTRADALSCIGDPPIRTPHLDALAAESVLYDQARTVTPLTLPSHASVLTGLYPPRHTVRDNGLMALPDSAQTLAELAAEEGLDTAAFLAAVVLDARWGLAQGFDVYDAPIAGESVGSSHYVQRPADEVVDAALGWLAQQDPEGRFLLWVHLFDPHVPNRLSYHVDVGFMDEHIGRLLDGVRNRAGGDETAILVVADHGEGLGDHGEETHGAYVYDSTLRVPLLLRAPGGPAGVRSDENVSVVDVLPTLSGLLGLPTPSGLDGLDLTLGVPDGRGVYFESYYGWLRYGWSPLAGWLDARGKYLHSSEPQLFDPLADPGELIDLIAQDDAEVAADRDLASHYLEQLARVAASPALDGGADRAPTDAATLEQLEALGYAPAAAPKDGFPAPGAPSERPSPAASSEELQTLLSAGSLIDSGLIGPSIELLEGVLANNPANWEALSKYGYALMRLDRMSDAIEPLERLNRDAPQRVNACYNLAVCLEATGRVDESLPWFERALELDPQEVYRLSGGAEQAHLSLARSLSEFGHLERAAEQYRALLGVEPEAYGAELELAVVLQALGEIDGAIQALSRSVEILEHDVATLAPEELSTLGSAQHDLAGLLLRQGDLEAATRHYASAIERVPDRAETHLGLGFAHYQAGRYDDARQAFEHAVTLEPTNARALYNLGVALATLGEASAAIETLKTAARSDPEHVPSRLYLGQLFERAGDGDSARRSYAEVLALAPGHAAATAALERLGE